ncbi:MAG: hypothetical protein K2G27_02635 [Duncaniella sp.]|nr:hypothetical protein [Duncaniella sp.]
MKRSFIFLLVFITNLIFTFSIEAAPKKVAVYVAGEMCDADKSIVCSSVLSRISGHKEYKAFERNRAFVNAINRECDYQLSGEVPENEIRELGERMGVDFIIVINSVISSDNKCHMSARIINLVSGEILKSASINREYTGADVLAKMANNVTYRLINNRSK